MNIGLILFATSMLLGVVGDNTDNEEPSDELDVTTNQVNNDSDNLAQKDADMSAKTVANAPIKMIQLTIFINNLKTLI
jgi:hypothetical protein